MQSNLFMTASNNNNNKNIQKRGVFNEKESNFILDRVGNVVHDDTNTNLRRR